MPQSVDSRATASAQPVRILRRRSPLRRVDAASCSGDGIVGAVDAAVLPVLTELNEGTAASTRLQFPAEGVVDFEASSKDEHAEDLCALAAVPMWTPPSRDFARREAEKLELALQEQAAAQGVFSDVLTQWHVVVAENQAIGSFFTQGKVRESQALFDLIDDDIAHEGRLREQVVDQLSRVNVTRKRVSGLHGETFVASRFPTPTECAKGVSQAASAKGFIQRLKERCARAGVDVRGPGKHVASSYAAVARRTVSPEAVGATASRTAVLGGTKRSSPEDISSAPKRHSGEVDNLPVRDVQVDVEVMHPSVSPPLDSGGVDAFDDDDVPLDVVRTPPSTPPPEDPVGEIEVVLSPRPSRRRPVPPAAQPPQGTFARASGEHRRGSDVPGNFGSSRAGLLSEVPPGSHAGDGTGIRFAFQKPTIRLATGVFVAARIASSLGLAEEGRLVMRGGDLAVVSDAHFVLASLYTKGQMAEVFAEGPSKLLDGRTALAYLANAAEPLRMAVTPHRSEVVDPEFQVPELVCPPILNPACAGFLGRDERGVLVAAVSKRLAINGTNDYRNSGGGPNENWFHRHNEILRIAKLGGCFPLRCEPGGVDFSRKFESSFGNFVKFTMWPSKGTLRAEVTRVGPGRRGSYRVFYFGVSAVELYSMVSHPELWLAQAVVKDVGDIWQPSPSK